MKIIGDNINDDDDRNQHSIASSLDKIPRLRKPSLKQAKTDFLELPPLIKKM